MRGRQWHLWIIWLVGFWVLLDTTRYALQWIGEDPRSAMSYHTPEFRTDDGQKPKSSLDPSADWDMLMDPDSGSAPDFFVPLREWMDVCRKLRQSLSRANIEVQGCRWFGWEAVLLSHPVDTVLNKDEGDVIHRQIIRIESLLDSLISLNALRLIEIEWRSEMPLGDHMSARNKLLLQFKSSALTEVWQSLVRHTLNDKLEWLRISPVGEFPEAAETYTQLEVIFTRIQPDRIFVGQHHWRDEQYAMPVWVFPDKVPFHSSSKNESIGPGEQPPGWYVVYYQPEHRQLEWQGTLRFGDQMTVLLRAKDNSALLYLPLDKPVSILGQVFEYRLKSIGDKLLLHWIWGPCKVEGIVETGQIIHFPVHLCLASENNPDSRTVWFLDEPKPWRDGILKLKNIDQKQNVAEFNYTKESGDNIVWHISLSDY